MPAALTTSDSPSSRCATPHLFVGGPYFLCFAFALAAAHFLTRSTAGRNAAFTACHCSGDQSPEDSAHRLAASCIASRS